MSDSAFGPTMSDSQGYLKEEEVERVIKHARNLRDRLILWLLYATGCRLTELLMLKVSDISFSDNVLFFYTLKRKKKRRYQRPVMVDAFTISLIRKYMEAYKIKEGPLIKIKKRRVRQIVLETGTRAGIPLVGSKHIHPHHFRHSHCVAWVRNNPTMEGLRKLQQRLGHASINTTAHYLQYAFGEQKEDVEKVLGKITL